MNQQEKQTQPPKLSERLSVAARMCRPGVKVADVGTDHAYLPIYLLLTRRIRGGVVSDIHRGPIERAEKNIREYGCEEQLVAVQCDGLNGIEQYNPRDIFILGMGGDLIASILAAAPWIKERQRKLILQPMTHPEAVRSFLISNGFSILDDHMVEEDGKFYQVLSAIYTGKEEVYTSAELLCGKHNLMRVDIRVYRYVERQIVTLTARREARSAAGIDTSYEDTLLRELITWRKIYHDCT